MPRGLWACSGLLANENSLQRLARRLVRSQRLRTLLRRQVMRANASAEPPPPLDAGTRSELQDRYFKEEIESLGTLIGRDLSCWGVEWVTYE